MAAPKVTDAEFIRIWNEEKSPQAVADRTGIALRNAYARRARMVKNGYDLPTRPAPGYNSYAPYAESGWTFPREKRIEEAQKQPDMFIEPAPAKALQEGLAL